MNILFRYDDHPPPPFRPVPDDYFRPLLPYEPHPIRPLPNRYGSLIPHPDDYTKRPNDYMYNKPDNNGLAPRPIYKPSKGDKMNTYGDKPATNSSNYGSTTEKNLKDYEGSKNKDDKNGNKKGESGYGGNKSIVSQSVGYNGEKITSIITEIPNSEYLELFYITLAQKTDTECEVISIGDWT